MAEPYVDETARDDPGAQVIPLPVEDPPEMPEMLELQQRVVELQHLSEQINVADNLEDAKLSELGALVHREYKIDDDSRSEWKERAKRAMDIAKQKKQPKTHPWPNASNVKYPMLTVAALQFAARAYPAICDGPRIVKTKVRGRDPDGMKAASAERVSQHMSFQLGTEIPEWEEDMDTCLHQIPIVGCAFKKVYRDPSMEAGFGNDLISAFDLVVNKSAKSLQRVPRITHCFHLYPHEISERQRDGRFVECDLSGTTDDNDDTDAPHLFLEQHRYYDLDDDGMTEPWIVTVHEKTEKVVRIRAGFDANKIDVDYQRFKITRIPRQDYFVKIPFIPDPEGGFYDVGFGHLLDMLSDAIDTTINQMLDAGTLQNSGGGFIGGGVDLGKGKAEIRMEPGKFKNVKGAGDDIRKAVVYHQHPGPSAVLFELLGMLLEASKDITAVQDVLTGDVSRNQTATTTMALIEQGLKVFTAIYKRIFRSLKREFTLIYEINKATLDMPKYVALLDEPVEVSQQDYQGQFDVEPVADPNSVTDMQRLAKAQVVMDEVRNGNPFVNPKVATERMLEAARIEKVEELVVDPPPNPIEEMEPAAAKAELEDKQLAVEERKLSLDKVMLEIDKLRAEMDKIAADATKTRAEVGITPGEPLPVPDLMFDEPPQEFIEPDMLPPDAVPNGMVPEGQMDGPPIDMAQQMSTEQLPPGEPV